MFVRRPVPRNSRAPARRSQRAPTSESGKPLLRLYIRNSWSNPQREGYVLEVREGPHIRSGKAGEKAFTQWIAVSDTINKQDVIGLPVSVCDALLKHLMTCGELDKDTPSDEAEMSETQYATSSDPQAPTPTQGSGDGNSQEDSTDGVAPTKLPSASTRTKFHLDRLSPLRIVCEATGCTIEVTSKDPGSKHQTDEDQETVPKSQAIRWIVSEPSGKSSDLNGSATKADETTALKTRQRPWEASGSIGLHASLMSQFCVFLADVATRYRSLGALPEVPSLYSPSGGRRFYFDLRETPWGKRLHISQVTDQHRNVIGVPLEELVTFRDRLDTLIQELSLDDQHSLRSKIYTRALVPRKTTRRTVPRARSGTTEQQTNGGSSDPQHDIKKRRRRFNGPRKMFVNERFPEKNKNVESDEVQGEPNGGLNQRQQNPRTSRGKRERRQQKGDIVAEDADKAVPQTRCDLKLEDPSSVPSVPVPVSAMAAEANA